jgi:serine/threonine protein kinase
MIIGTPYYMSPEQCRGEELDARSDIYSLGTILYEMLTGQVPFKLQSLTPVGVALRITQEPPRPPSELRPDMPKPVEAVILRALAKRREHRQGSAIQLARELEHALRDAGIGLKVLGTDAPQSIFPQPSSPYTSDRAFSPERIGSAAPSRSSGTLSPDLVQTGAHAIFEKEVSKGLFQIIPRLLLIGLPILAVLVFIILGFTLTLSASEGDSGADYLPGLFVAILLAIGISAAIYLLVRRRKPSAPITSVPQPESQPQPSPPPISEIPSITLGQPRIPQQDTTPTVKVSPLEKTVAEEKTEPISEKRSPSYYDLQSVEISKQCPECGEDYPASKKYCHNDGQRLIEVKKDKPEEMEPVLIGQYKCFARLGEGGMGIVYKAHHIHLDRLSAVKVLLPQIAAMLPNAVQMFRREARLASSINHPNSVIIYDYGEVGTSLFYLAMEFIHGESLAQIITPEGQPSQTLSLPRAFDITKQICDALDTAHQLGIVHRDLKPQNVMICKKANGKDLVKVLDFGIARSLKGQGDFQTTPGTIMGTPAYMSPEQANGLPNLDSRSDIFSLGLIVYEMLSGKLPFRTSGLTPMQMVLQRASLTAPPPLLSTFADDLMIPPSVGQVLMRALEPNRDKRTQSIKEFVDELETAIH